MSDRILDVQRLVELQNEQQQQQQQQNQSNMDDDLSLSTLNTIETMGTSDGVGRGTLLMDALRSPEVAARQYQQQQEQQQQQQADHKGGSSTHPNSLMLPKNSTSAVMLGAFAGPGGAANYGAMNANNNNNPYEVEGQDRGLASYQQQQQQQGHDFNYSHPDAYHHDPYAPDESSSSFCFKYCCLLRPIWSCLQSEALWRSFCLGSIDGMLTGGGIVAAFWGTGLVSLSHSPANLRLLTVVFSAAACLADALGMALGHVWTTKVQVTSHGQERHTSQREFLENPSLCKGLLVDLLLQRGMLKIDAMSLADTLEGYPDLFVSAMMGDSLTMGAPPARHEAGPEPKQGGSGPLSTIPSYGRYHELVSMEDPEVLETREAVWDATKESCFMMMGFSLFAVVPSLIYYLLPSSGAKDGHEQDLNLLDDSIVPDNSSPFVQPGTLFFFGSCIIMAGLGAWKSHFGRTSGTPNALLFALEAVAVLLVCLCAGFGAGFLLSLVIPDQYVIQISS